MAPSLGPRGYTEPGRITSKGAPEARKEVIRQLNPKGDKEGKAFVSIGEPITAHPVTPSIRKLLKFLQWHQRSGARIQCSGTHCGRIVFHAGQLR